MIKSLDSSDILSIPRSEYIHHVRAMGVDQVHIWYIPFNENFIDTKILSFDEIMRAYKYKFDIHKKQFIMYRCALRHILSFYYDKKPEELVFRYTEYKKPYVSSNLQFNLSHSNDMAVLGIIKSCQIGIDIECVKPFADIYLVAKQFFSQTEYLKFISLPEQDKLEAFYDIWTRKEAFIKAIGKGLSYPLDKVVVSFSANELPRIIEINNSRTEAIKWSIKSFKIQAENRKYKIACAVKSNSYSIDEFVMPVD